MDRQPGPVHHPPEGKLREAMMKLFNPDGTARPASKYFHGALIPAGGERLVIAGQVGIAPDGTLEQGF